MFQARSHNKEKKYDNNKATILQISIDQVLLVFQAFLFSI